jgi:hypothetical protein
MKGVSTITLVAVLAISLLGMNNAFAQDDNGTIRNDTGLMNSIGMMNATLAYAAPDNSEIGEKYRDMGENIGREFENIEKGTTGLNENSTTMMNATLPRSIIGNDTAKPMNAILQISLGNNGTSSN